MAEMAQRDLDAALQLLADRAQYITGSSGAAIALRRLGKNDMLCRASSGENAPELGALLSTEFGLSGESVRTRRPLRCDDAERDARVNREVCREMGIASVVVMPVVHDDEVMGVFELFSGKVNAFGERDLSALQRLSEMVETAVELAHSAQSVAEQLKTAEPAADRAARELADEPVLEVEAETELRSEVAGELHAATPMEVAPDTQGAIQKDLEADSVLEVAPEITVAEPPTTPLFPPAAAVPAPPAPQHEEIISAPAPAPATASTAPALPAKKVLFWSAASVNAELPEPSEADQSHVPPVLRHLRKCEACGFPVSAGRALCVECEEKKWRGQLRVPPKTASRQGSVEAAASATLPKAKPSAAAGASASNPGAPLAVAGAATPASTPAARAVAAASPSTTSPIAAPLATVNHASSVKPASILTLAAAASAAPRSAAKPPSNSAVAVVEPSREPARPTLPVAGPELVLSAGLAPTQSWLSANKYILGALLVIGAVVAAVLFLR